MFSPPANSCFRLCPPLQYQKLELIVDLLNAGEYVCASEAVRAFEEVSLSVSQSSEAVSKEGRERMEGEARHRLLRSWKKASGSGAESDERGGAKGEGFEAGPL